MMPTVQLLISGKVQGVYYRASAKETAESLQVTGTVKNNRQGQVEIFATGSEESLKNFIAWCYEGPPGAAVEDIKIDRLKDQEFIGFSIVR
jgi:acylphosphatase